MVLTPEAVTQKVFLTTKFREGYDQDEVDDFLDEVVAELTRLNTENAELRNKLASCEHRLADVTRAGASNAAAQQPVQPQPPQPVQPRVAPAPAVAQLSPATSIEASPVAALGASGMGGQSSEQVAGIVSLAQKLHDEHVRSGENKRDQLIQEAETHAARLVSEAEKKQRETLGSLERERSLLERKIDELRAFERDYRSRLKSYLETQLRDLDTKGAIVPGRGSSQPAENGFAYGGAN